MNNSNGCFTRNVLGFNYSGWFAGISYFSTSKEGQDSHRRSHWVHVLQSYSATGGCFVSDSADRGMQTTMRR